MNWLSIIVILTVSPLLLGSVTLQFSDSLYSLNQLEDSSDTGPTNGLLWGILIDTNGNGFDHLAFTIDTTTNLNDGAKLSPGDLFFAGGLTVFWPLGAESGSGTITTANDLNPYSFPSVAAGQSFAIVWFDSGVSEGDDVSFGSLYGIITNASLLLPADGTGTVSFAHLFAGPDPIRPTDKPFTALIPASTTSSIITLTHGGGPDTQHLAYQFPVSVINDDSGTLTYTLWRSSDLADWAIANQTTQVLSDDGTTRILQIFDPKPISQDPKRFIRLEITP